MTDNNQLIVNQCKNCTADVSGHTYCPVCGQKSNTHVLTFRELLEEIADGLFNMDSRIWRSLIPLALRPGKLTLEYLKGRRMYYLPPFRLYLILSVLYFLLPNVDQGTTFIPGAITDQDNGDLANIAGQVGEADPAALDAELETVLEDAGIRNELARQIREEVQQELADARQDEDLADVTECNVSGLEPGSLTTAILRDTCLKFRDNPDELFQQVIDSIPIMMIVGIPLVALLMQFFYMFSGRYYVEHVIFLLHVHAFYFLVGIAMALSSILGQRFVVLFGAMDWFRIIAGFYIPIYIFLSMLKVYGDSKKLTSVKAFFLLIGYGICIAIVFGIVLVYTAMVN